jgi:hypothetical protein
VFLESWAVALCVGIIALRSHTLSQVMWAALNSGRPILAIRKVVCPPGVLFFYGYMLFTFARSGWPRSFPDGSSAEFWAVSVIFIGAGVLAACAWFFADPTWSDPMMKRLKREFRWVAQQSVPEPHDPRFGRWDVTKPFPQLAAFGWFGR